MPEVDELQQVLHWAGFAEVCGPIDGDYGARTTEAVRRFQLGYSFAELAVDGDAGPLTWAALEECIARDAACGRNFVFREFASKGNGEVLVHRELVRALDNYRDALGRPVGIRSGYRDPAHNARVGGVSDSQHVKGTGVDLAEHALYFGEVRNLRQFSGIGYVADTGLVLHVDVRHVNGDTWATPDEPAVWTY